jgi:hypothetical protein
MSEKSIQDIILRSTYLACEDLTDVELNALYLGLRLGYDPKQIAGYDKAKFLYTEQNGTRMHDTIASAFEQVWSSRIGRWTSDHNRNARPVPSPTLPAQAGQTGKTK